MNIKFRYKNYHVANPQERVFFENEIRKHLEQQAKKFSAFINDDSNFSFTITIHSVAHTVELLSHHSNHVCSNTQLNIHLSARSLSHAAHEYNHKVCGQLHSLKNN